MSSCIPALSDLIDFDESVICLTSRNRLFKVIVMSDRDVPSLLPSLLDRLLVENPRSSVEPPKSVTQLVREAKLSMQRDLQDLLNAKWRMLAWPEEMEQLDDSLANYGVPDFAQLENPLDVWSFCLRIQEVIDTYEPRLKQVKCTPYSEIAPEERSLSFRIDAILNIELLDDEVSFRSTVQPSTGMFLVRRSSIRE